VSSLAFHADQAFYRIPGGIGTYQRELVPALAQADPRLEITLFHARFDRPAEPWMDRFRTVRLPHRISRLYAGWGLTGRPALPPALAALDILHTPSPVAVPPPGRRQGLVVTVHDVAFRTLPGAFPSLPWAALFRLGLRRTVRLADAIIVPSHHTALDLARLTRADPARIHTVPLAVSPVGAAEDPGPALQRLKIPRPYLLFVGTLEPRKNLIRLIRAYRRAAFAVPHALVLAGQLGWRSERLNREVAISGRGQVVLTGHVPATDLDALYRGADAFCYPSLYEGFGLPVLEAMARGVPVVTSTASSLPEVAGDAAILVEPRSVRELAAAIERVLTDRDEAERLGAMGRDRAARFTWERTARMTLDVYEAVRR
jgi:glycosyltransferase involved in cell wall biosynthesis